MKINRMAWLLFAITALGLGLRLVYIWQVKSTPVFGFYAVDAKSYDAFALKILGGNFLFKDAIYLEPLYPFILAAIYKIFTHSLIAVAVLQAAIDTLTGLMLYFISLRIFNKKAIGLSAFFIYSCYAVSIFYTAFILDVTLSIFLVVSSVLATLYAQGGRENWRWYLAGFIWGLAILVRANVLLIMPFILIWIFVRNGNGKFGGAIRCALLAAGLLTAALPFSLRNYAIAGNFSPLAANGGINFYMGNHPGARGGYTYVDGVSNTAVYQAKQSAHRAELESGRELSPFQASNYWFSKGLEFIRREPFQATLITLRKAYLFWNHAEIAQNESFYFCKSYVPILRFPLFSFGVVAPFAIAGLLFAVQRREAGAGLIVLSILSYMASLVVFIVVSRYRLPVVPLIIVMASYALYQSAVLLARRRIRELIFYGITVSITFFLVNIDTAIAGPGHNLAINHNNLGVSYYERGAIREAIAEYEKALVEDPYYAETYNNLGAAYYSLGDLEGSARSYRKAIEINEGFVEARYGLGNVYSALGRGPEAAAMYKRVIELDPGFVEAYNNLAYIDLASGNVEEAEALCRAALEVDPKYAKAYNNLGIIYARRGRIPDAVKMFEETLAIDPDDESARKNLERSRAGR